MSDDEPGKKYYKNILESVYNHDVKVSVVNACSCEKPRFNTAFVHSFHPSVDDSLPLGFVGRLW